MSRVSMTYPEYLRNQCMLDGVRIHLSPHETELLAMLLVTRPDRVAEYEAMVEVIWPNPDEQALTAMKSVTVLKYRLAGKGIEIKTERGRGLHIAEENRGGRSGEPLRLAA
jgi:DNA-binding response OmpR family regulator